LAATAKQKRQKTSPIDIDPGFPLPISFFFVVFFGWLICTSNPRFKMQNLKNQSKSISAAKARSLPRLENAHTKSANKSNCEFLLGAHIMRICEEREDILSQDAGQTQSLSFAAFASFFIVICAKSFKSHTFIKYICL